MNLWWLKNYKEWWFTVCKRFKLFVVVYVKRPSYYNDNSTILIPLNSIYRTSVFILKMWILLVPKIVEVKIITQCDLLDVESFFHSTKIITWLWIQMFYLQNLDESSHSGMMVSATAVQEECRDSYGRVCRYRTSNLLCCIQRQL